MSLVIILRCRNNSLSHTTPTFTYNVKAKKSNKSQHSHKKIKKKIVFTFVSGFYIKISFSSRGPNHYECWEVTQRDWTLFIKDHNKREKYGSDMTLLERDDIKFRKSRKQKISGGGYVKVQYQDLFCYLNVIIYNKSNITDLYKDN